MPIGPRDASTTDWSGCAGMIKMIKEREEVSRYSLSLISTTAMRAYEDV